MSFPFDRLDRISPINRRPEEQYGRRCDRTVYCLAQLLLPGPAIECCYTTFFSNARRCCCFEILTFYNVATSRCCCPEFGSVSRRQSHRHPKSITGPPISRCFVVSVISRRHPFSLFRVAASVGPAALFPLSLSGLCSPRDAVVALTSLVLFQFHKITRFNASHKIGWFFFFTNNTQQNKAGYTAKPVACCWLINFLN